VLDFDVGREHEYFRTVSTSAVVSNSSADAMDFPLREVHWRIGNSKPRHGPPFPRRRADSRWAAIAVFDSDAKLIANASRRTCGKLGMTPPLRPYSPRSICAIPAAA
jgi:hypothetical protein